MDKLDDYKLFFCTLTDGKFGRYGMPFKTRNKFYFYDTGTGKVFECRKNVFDVLEYLFEGGSLEYIEEHFDNEELLLQALEEIKLAVQNENILKFPEIKCFDGDQINCLEHYVNNELGQITLELTERCNLRCSYCIYGGENDVFRNFGSTDMTFEVAKKAIDYAMAHSGEEIALAFYGGEPLLKFDLLKECVEYCKSFKEKTISFSMTTNLTLMDKEKACYFAKEPNFNICCSIDGPKDIHDAFRTFPNGQGSFELAFQGLRNISEALGEDTVNRLSFSMVLTPPYDEEKFNNIQSFFNSIEGISANTQKLISYVQYGKMKSKDESKQPFDPLEIWSKKYIQDGKDLELGEVFTTDKLEQTLSRIHKRRLCNEPMQNILFQGCCIPGSRRLYVTTLGKFKLCERIGLSPYIGDVFRGIELDLIKKYYVEDYVEASIPLCNMCWAAQLCGLCYTECYTEEGIDIENRYPLCQSQRFVLKNGLIQYHEILEKNPESLCYLNNLDYQ